jgi:hypothetical protein
METITAAMEKPVSGRKARTSSSAFPVALLQRKCACGGTATSASQGECEECRKKKLQRRAADLRDVGGAPPIVEEVLDSSGQPLDSATREFMEPHFGHDFSRVRVHTDHKASQSAKAVNALAYTVGHNVVFAGGQYAPGKKSGQKLLAHELTHVVQQRKMANAAPQSKLEIGPANDSLEQEADRFAEKVAGVSAAATATPPMPPARSSNNSRPLLQRAPADQTPATTAPAVSAPGLIVDDEVQQLADGQMHKTEFLDKLHAEVCVTSDAALAPAGRTSQGCPFIEKWIARLRGRSGQHIEKAIRKYAPESAGATRAADYIAPVGAKVQRGVSRWAATGEISGVPPELMAEVMGGGILGALGSSFSGLVSGIGGALSSVGHLFTKANDGGARTGNPLAIQAQLNLSGMASPLNGGVRTRMESAFGHSFGNVRVHADSSAAHLASSLNSRAFTVGNDVAFAAGEYQPGTLVGEALIAHELAHVIQQGNGAAGASMAKGATEYNTLEEDADVSAVSAMVSAWSGAKGSLKDIGKNAMPRLRSGLKLQRCGAKPPVGQVAPAAVNLHQAAERPCDPAKETVSPTRTCCTQPMLDQIVPVLADAIPSVDGAFNKLASPAGVASQLAANFAIKPNDRASIDKIRATYSRMLKLMIGTASGSGTPKILCSSNQACHGHPANSTSGCSASGQLSITLCGDYTGPDYLGGGPNGAPKNEWVRYIIHEYAHVSCPPAALGIPGEEALGAGVQIRGEDTEYYKNDPRKRPYPGAPEQSLTNADCYAWFAMDVR